MQPNTNQSAFLDDASSTPDQSAFLDASGSSNSDSGNSAFTDIQPQDTILPENAPLTQHFGNYNPSLEVFSQGVARDTNFAVNPNTPVRVPEGQWKVVSAYTQAPQEGYPGDGNNLGYGNDILVQNTQTGEKLHMIHLSNVSVKPGQIVPGGSLVGASGTSGNATGPNLGIEYYDPQGNIGDVMQSPYAQYLPKNQGEGGSGGGGFGQIIGQVGNTIKNFLNSDYQDQKAMSQGDQVSQAVVEKTHPAANPLYTSPLPTMPEQIPTVVPESPLKKIANVASTVINAFSPDAQAVQAQTQTPQKPEIDAVGATDYEKKAARLFEKYGVPAPVGLGVWAMEGRGRTINPNNPYNIGAYDSNPENANAYGFKTPLEGTEAAAQFLAGQSPYMASDKKQIFQKAMQDLKKNHDVDAYLRTIAPTYSSNPNYADVVESTPEYTRWAGGH